MDLKQIRYFVAVAEARSFTLAAEQLHITQPPLSRQIQLLEQSLGVQLIERDSRPLQLTEAGRLFYEQSVQILLRIEHMQLATSRLGQSYQQRLTIGFAASSLYGGLPILIQSFRKTYPNIRLQFLELTSTEQLEALKSGRIDIGFGRVRVHDPAIARITFREERLALAMASTSPFALEKEPICLSALNHQTLITYPSQPRPSFADYVLNVLHDKRIYPADIQEVLSLQTALGLVSAGEGFCVIPTAARIRQDIFYRLIRDDDVSSPIIFSHRKKDNSWYIQAMQHLVHKMYVDHPELLHPDNCINP
ncbi:DNA-binding transcriptional LysR family regulator [Paenalcaligenes hominis]|uniref:DNA-binding transcriptional LysR family regulator n=1 Tax=Paenalcaligenes hominis TaxID=643674 RepID=A0ABX0WTC9_9BURK|nr:LysR family transcriptional regulator [Paenalcaligenes hominis]NJB66040.1 DNA-binding transcriptional LysR family regulator [Paenalcaligenes hominis]GGE71597.1 LysR family transcriptional regulator [Paenalcaligenes hominis]